MCWFRGESPHWEFCRAEDVGRLHSTKLPLEVFLNVCHPESCLTKTHHRKYQGWQGPLRSLACFRGLFALWVTATILIFTPILGCILRQIIQPPLLVHGESQWDAPYQAAISVPNCLGTELSPDLILRPPHHALFHSHLLYTKIKIKCISNLWRYVVSIQNWGRTHQRHNKESVCSTPSNQMCTPFISLCPYHLLIEKIFQFLSDLCSLFPVIKYLTRHPDSPSKSEQKPSNHFLSSAHSANYGSIIKI